MKLFNGMKMIIYNDNKHALQEQELHNQYNFSSSKFSSA